MKPPNMVYGTLILLVHPNSVPKYRKPVPWWKACIVQAYSIFQQKLRRIVPYCHVRWKTLILQKPLHFFARQTQRMFSPQTSRIEQDWKDLRFSEKLFKIMADAAYLKKLFSSSLDFLFRNMKLLIKICLKIPQSLLIFNIIKSWLECAKLLLKVLFCCGLNFIHQLNQNFSLYSLYYSWACNEFESHLRVIAPAGNKASLEEMLLRWRAVGNTVSNLTGPRSEPQISRSKDDCVVTRPGQPVHLSTNLSILRYPFNHSEV